MNILQNILNKDNSFYDSKVGLIFQSFFVNCMLFPYYKLLFKIEVKGRENIPSKEALIFASTHTSHHDPPLLATATRKHIAYMAKKELFDIPVLSQLISALGAFPVNREKPEIKTIKTARRVIASKRWNLGIFPQGTRIPDGSLDSVKSGFSHIARITKSTVVPVYIDFRWGKYPIYGKIVVHIGKPLPVSDNAEEIEENWKKAVSELAGREYIALRPAGAQKAEVL